MTSNGRPTNKTRIAFFRNLPKRWANPIPTTGAPNPQIPKVAKPETPKLPTTQKTKPQHNPKPKGRPCKKKQSKRLTEGKLLEKPELKPHENIIALAYMI